jgi:hypothetical protein
MGRISRGWQLTKMSLGVIRKDKEILLFPVISGLVLIAIIATYFGFWFFSGGFTSDFNTLNWAFYLFWFVFYLISYFLVVFFNVAIVACAMKRLEGGDPTFSYGIGFAASRVKYIFEWAIVAATVGLIIRAISERAGFVGKIIMGFVGMAWSIATYFVVPIIAFENVGPIDAIKKSAGILKRSWGEALVSNLGMGLVFLGLGAIGLVPLLVAIVLGSVTAILVAVSTVFVYWLILVIIASAAQTVLLTALFRYATTGKVSEDFPENALKNPWAF